MDIKHSRRLLAVGAPDSGVLDVIKDLTGSTPPLNENGSTAGTTHEWNVNTAYYRTTVPIWLDEITDVEEWKSEFLKPEAKEVVEAVGAWVYCFRTATGDGPSPEVVETLKAIHEVVEAHAGYGADSVMLAVSMPSGQVTDNAAEGKADDWEDVCLDHGFEYVDYRAKGTNEFGEKVGFERLKEALEANEWAATIHSDDEDGDGDVDFDQFGFGSEEDAFTREDEAERAMELFGMKAALAGVEGLEPEAGVSQSGDDVFAGGKTQEAEVEDFDRLMGKLLAVKEQGAELPEAQRKRMAAKAVRDLVGEGGGLG